MADLCPDCGRPLATTAREQATDGYCWNDTGCLRAQLAAKSSALAASEREVKAWRALAAESSGSARSLDFSLHKAGSHGAEIVDYPGYGHVVATDAVYNMESFQAAAIDLATKLGLIDSGGTVKL